MDICTDKKGQGRRIVGGSKKEEKGGSRTNERGREGIGASTKLP